MVIKKSYLMVMFQLNGKHIVLLATRKNLIWVNVAHHFHQATDIANNVL